MIPVKKSTIKYMVVHRNGRGFHTVTSMIVKLITKLSYVGELYADEVCVARNRRFFFADAIHPILTIGETGLVKGELPDIQWDIPEIKIYLDSKGVDYTGVSDKPALLALVETGGA